jgi:hypothetical protein
LNNLEEQGAKVAGKVGIHFTHEVAVYAIQATPALETTR